MRYCCHCGKQHDNRRSAYCSPDCRRADRIAVRREIAKIKCRLCGRRFRRSKPSTLSNGHLKELDRVRSAHTHV